MTSTQSNGTDVIALVQQDHREIEKMLDAVAQTTGERRQDAFEDLVRKLAVHETAEEEVVHPLTRTLGASGVYDSVTSEEDTAKKSLAKLDGVDVTSAAFDTQFQSLKTAVLAHAQHEERDEHPRIRDSEDREKLVKLGRYFEMAERSAPTRPHANAPESRAGNLMLGPILAVSDRVRDALRDAMKDT